ncbi:hypothetical protein BOQ63_037720 [Streptomyces viridifaciens]|nr:hypothetical protein BOQ63_037720 [Streptomyces viridifaciens]
MTRPSSETSKEATVVLGIAHVPAVHLLLGVRMFGLSVLALARRTG